MSTNGSEAVALEASVTVSVIVLEPKLFGAGVTVTVRDEPVPETTMLLRGTSAVSVEATLIARLLSGSSMSPIVKLRALVEVSSSIV